jgi:hypothetical protein
VDAPSPRVLPVAPPPPITPPGEFDHEAEAVPAAYVPTPYLAKPVGFTTAPPPIRPLQWDQPRVLRVRSSQVTFGIFGRVVVTLLILAFLAWLLLYSAPFILPALPMSVWALKDNWRRAPVRRAPEPTLVADGPRVVARNPFAPLATDVVFDPHVRLPEPGATQSA